jgi:N-acetylneuraminate synthase
MAIKVGNKVISRHGPTYIVAEIGINHNGDIAIAKRLIDTAIDAGCDAVKFQKRNPDVCVPEHQKGIMRETPWGAMTYLDYKRRIEFGKKEYDVIDQYCRKVGIDWFVSPWDVDSVKFMAQYDTPAFKIASATITDLDVLSAVAETKKPVVISSGMSTQQEVDAAIEIFDRDKLVVCHSVSSYPAPIDELNLNVIKTYLNMYPDLVIGYSGHEVGLVTTYAAVVLGARYVERHITLDRTMWGTDQAASIEPRGVESLVGKIRAVERSLGDGVKKVENSEIAVRKKLRIASS